MSDDNVIQFPGAKPKSSPASEQKAKPPRSPEDLTEEQRKAIGIIMSGRAFVLVGIEPTQTGADFYTAVYGEKNDLRNALSHLPDVIVRAFNRKGI